jgi:cell division protease FtsH
MEATRLLTEHRRQLDALAEALVVRETLNEQEILKITGLPRARSLETAKLAAGDSTAKDLVRRSAKPASLAS